MCIKKRIWMALGNLDGVVLRETLTPSKHPNLIMLLSESTKLIL